MSIVTLTQAAEIAAFAETYAKERFGADVAVRIERKAPVVSGVQWLSVIYSIAGACFGYVVGAQALI